MVERKESVGVCGTQTFTEIPPNQILNDRMCSLDFEYPLLQIPLFLGYFLKNLGFHGNYLLFWQRVVLVPGVSLLLRLVSRVFRPQASPAASKRPGTDGLSFRGELNPPPMGSGNCRDFHGHMSRFSCGKTWEMDLPPPSPEGGRCFVNSFSFSLGFAPGDQVPGTRRCSMCRDAVCQTPYPPNAWFPQDALHTESAFCEHALIRTRDESHNAGKQSIPAKRAGLSNPQQAS